MSAASVSTFEYFKVFLGYSKNQSNFPDDYASIIDQPLTKPEGELPPGLFVGDNEDAQNFDANDRSEYAK